MRVEWPDCQKSLCISAVCVPTYSCILSRPAASSLLILKLFYFIIIDSFFSFSPEVPTKMLSSVLYYNKCVYVYILLIK